MDLALINFFLISDLKKIIAGKKICDNEEYFVETEAYFEAKDKSNEKIGARWKLCCQKCVFK